MNEETLIVFNDSVAERRAAYGKRVFQTFRLTVRNVFEDNYVLYLKHWIADEADVTMNSCNFPMKIPKKFPPLNEAKKE